MKFDVNKLRSAIDEWSMNMGEEDIHIKIPSNEGKKREHLGLSMIGDPCVRAAFYRYRKVSKPVFPPRILRLFQRGHREEFFFEHMLRGVGLKIWNVDPKTGKQFHVSDFDGHLQGSMDGVAKDINGRFTKSTKPFKTEYKTYNDKRFQKLKKEGLKKSDPKYWDQVQGYLGYEPRLGGSLFLAVNKNDDDIHILWIDPCPKTFEKIKVRADQILGADRPPRGISLNYSDWRCAYCDFKENCFKGKESVKSCRSCFFSQPAEGGEWECTKGRDYGILCERWEDINR